MRLVVLTMRDGQKRTYDRDRIGGAETVVLTGPGGAQFVGYGRTRGEARVAASAVFEDATGGAGGATEHAAAAGTRQPAAAGALEGKVSADVQAACH